MDDPKETYLADARWVGRTGIGRFASEVIPRIPNLRPIDLRIRLLHPLDPIWLTATLIRERPDVYFSPGYNAPLWSPVPFIFSIHDLIPLRFPQDSPRLKRLYYKTVLWRAAHQAYRVITASEFAKREIVGWTGLEPERVAVVPLAAGSEFTPQGDRHDPGYPYLLYVGNRRGHKNLRRLLRAYSDSGVSNRVRLLLSGPPDAEMVALAARLRIADSLVFAGFIPDAVLPSYYRGALSLVFPSLYEGFGLPAIEAMACGLPVMASSTTSLPEVVGEAGYLVDPYDASSISDAIKLVASDLDLRQELSAKGLKRAQDFSWELTAAQVHDILRQAAGK
jgi:glycosyltransferase involved in cell wall biosynthesis